MTSACASIGSCAYTNPIIQLQRKPAEQQPIQQISAVKSEQTPPVLSPRTTIGSFDILV